MHVLGFWMPGPWELLICGFVAIVFLGAAVGAVVAVVVLAGRKER